MAAGVPPPSAMAHHPHHRDLLQLTDFAANDALVAMEEQLRHRTAEVHSLRDELERAKSELATQQQQQAQARKPENGVDGRPSDGAFATVKRSDSATIAATLMGQIQFLHGEVERLEKELKKVRAESATASRAIHSDHARVLQERSEEVERLSSDNEKLRSRLVSFERKYGKAQNGEDLSARCRMLETQLSQALSEKQAAMVDMHNSAIRARKLEAMLRGARDSADKLEQTVTAEAEASDAQVKSLHQVISALSRDRDQLREELGSLRSRDPTKVSRATAGCQTETARRETDVQTLPAAEKTFATDGCQVDTVKVAGESYGDSSAQLVAHTLQQRCDELDSARAQLEELSAAHHETVAIQQQTKKRLNEEFQQRRVMEDENEKLLAQVRALQQHNSQLTKICRDQQAAVEAADQRAQQATSTSLRVAEERRQWEAEMQNQQRDMQQLVAAQNLSNQQLAQHAQENDVLREECQKLLQRDAQVAFALRAKETEVQELIGCYQEAVRELEKAQGSIQSLARENDNLRAAVASREERLATLMDQVNQLHSREKQLAVDLHSADYEGEIMHNKMIRAEAEVGKLSSQLQELNNQIAAVQRVNFEFERNNAELLKQVLIKDNAIVLLRARCDEMEGQYATLCAQHEAEHQRLVELEDAHARLVVKGIIASQQQATQPAPTHLTGSPYSRAGGSSPSARLPSRPIDPAAFTPDNTPRSSERVSAHPVAPPPHFPHA